MGSRRIKASGVPTLVCNHPKVPEGGTTLREAPRGNLPLRALCGGLSERSAGVSPRVPRGLSGGPRDFPRFSGVVTLYACDPRELLEIRGVSLAHAKQLVLTVKKGCMHTRHKRMAEVVATKALPQLTALCD